VFENAEGLFSGNSNGEIIDLKEENAELKSDGS